MSRDFSPRAETRKPVLVARRGGAPLRTRGVGCRSLHLSERTLVRVRGRSYHVRRMGQEELVVHGAREHNLKDITVRLPRNALICITGLSGSGKSSLAFDTIYAEGQRRYVESLSAYARQFLQMMEKPDVDSIDGLSPAISIDQKTTSRNPRSTVGTVTEIYDYLRLLYARVGRPHCPVCGRPIAGQSLEAIVDQILQLEEGTRFTVNAPVVRDRKGEYRDLFEELRNEGFTRVKVDGRTAPARGAAGARQEVQAHDRGRGRPARDEGRPAHAADAVGRDGGAARGRARRRRPGGAVDGEADESLLFSEKFACPEHGVSLPELQPRIFSFNAPHGACPRCTGLGAQQEIDPDLLVPDPSLSINEGALVPWSVGNSSFYESVDPGDRRALRDRPRRAVAGARRGAAEPLPLRHERRQGLRPVPQPDGPAALVHARLRGDRPEPAAPLPRDRLGLAARADRGVHVASGPARSARAPG